MRSLHKLLKNTSGNVTLFFGISSAVLAGAAGIAMTMAQTDLQETHLQASLDAAVLAGTSLPYTASDTQRIATAELVFDTNSKGAGKMDVATRNREFALGEITNLKFTVTKAKVSGMASSIVRNGLVSSVGIGEFEIKSTAEAVKMDSDPVCVLALSPSSPNGLEVYGNAEFKANNCAVQANSTSSVGMRTYGKGKASASQFGVTGNFSGESFSPPPFSGIEPVIDPYKLLPVPTPGACVNVGSKIINTEIALNPGTYCGGLNIKAGSTVHLSPGSYIMQDGQFSVNSGAKVFGEEVTIFFVGANSYLHMLSDAEVTVTSPKKGTYKNIQMMSDRELSASKFNEEWTTIRSGAKLNYDGVLYLPEQQFWVSGTAHEAVIKGSSPTMIMVADKIWAQGNAVFDLTREDKRGIGDDMGHAAFRYGALLVR